MRRLEFHHIALSVRDIERSAAWYERLFGLDKVAEIARPAPMKIYVTPQGQAIDLREDPAVAAEPFTPERAGLDHVAFGCRDLKELEKWHARLEELGIANSGVGESDFGEHLNFRDPDGIALEFFVPRPRPE